MHNNVPLQSILPSLGIDKSPSTSQHGNATSSSNTDCLVDPILAFVKAHRLRGDLDSLKSVLYESFDTSKIISAVKSLYEFCRSDLDRLGFSYQGRRSSDKRQLFNAVFSDLISAFDKLDMDNSLPAIYCESFDLIHLPSLELDPVSKQLDLNSKAISSLSAVVEDLPGTCAKVVTDEVASSLDSLKALVDSAKVIKDKLSSTMDATVKSLAAKCSVSAPSSSMRASKSQPDRSQPDRSTNIIVFGLPECSSLSETKSEVDKLLHFVTSKDVPWSDAFRLGRRNPPSSPTVSVWPRPLLVKLTSILDKRLVLASKRVLKEYSVPRIFINEDLPLEVRRARAQKRQSVSNSRAQHSSPPASVPLASTSSLSPSSHSGHDTSSVALLSDDGQH